MQKIITKLKNIELKKYHKFLILFGIIFILLPVFNTNLWFDESYSVGIANQSFKDIWTIGAYDVHPVLYYWMLKVVNLLTNRSIMAYKIFSAIPIILTSILGYTHIRKDFGEKTGIIFSFLAIFLPEMGLFAGEVRMYSWALFAVTVLAIYAYRLSKEDNVKNWIIFGISSLASIYLHYYGLMAAGLINMALLISLIKNKRKKGLIFIISFGILQVIAYMPWILVLISQMSSVSNGFWIGFEFPDTIMEILSGQLSGYISMEIPTVIAVILYAYLIYKAVKLHRNGEDIKPFKLSAGIYIAVIIAALVVTLILWSSILYYRYLFVITGLYIFAISYILSKDNNKKAVAVILIIIAILGICNTGIMLYDNYDSTDTEPIEYLRENIEPGDTIVYTDCGVGSVVACQFLDNQVYFYNGPDWGVEEAYKAFEPNYETVVNIDFLENCSNRIWIIDNAKGTAYNEVFEGNEKYEKISEEKFYTEYHNYNWKITLVEVK